MRKLIVCLTVLFSFHFSYSQSGTVNGIIRDTSEQKTLSKAVVSVLRKADSVLVAFTRTNENGEFSLKA